MRSHRRRGPLEHVLVAADATELGAVFTVLALLPEHAYGQVYVETADDLPTLPAPARVTVTRVERGAAPGERLSDAVAGWVAEWLPEEPQDDRAVTLWCGATVRRDLGLATQSL